MIDSGIIALYLQVYLLSALQAAGALDIGNLSLDLYGHHSHMVSEAADDGAGCNHGFGSMDLEAEIGSQVADVVSRGQHSHAWVGN
jgi:hypothetical protein